MGLGFTGERIVPGAPDCEPTFAQKMYQEHIARYAFASQLAKDCDVLDVGCGVGYGSQFLAKAGAKSVLAFDISEEAIQHARMNYFHPTVSYTVQDATSIQRADGYDLITCFELIEHIDHQEHVLDLIKDALRSDGILVISTPRPLDEIRTHFHVHEMSFEELHGMLKQRFRHVEAYFEVNCFTSFVGDAFPSNIDQIIPITHRIGMDYADYFVFIASDTPISERANIRPLLSLNDDSYVLNLEHDIDVLKRAENDHVARLDSTRRALADTSENLANTQTEAHNLRCRADELGDRAASQERELDALRHRFKEAESALARLRASFSWKLTRPLRWAWRNYRKLTVRNLSNE